MRAFTLMMLVALIPSMMGCLSLPQPKRPYPGFSEQHAASSPEMDEFWWGEARIRLGMSKSDVIDQIKASGLQEWDGKYGIDMPSSRLRKANEWILGFGNSSGAAPGGGAVRLVFIEGEVARIVAMPCAA